MEKSSVGIVLGIVCIALAISLGSIGILANSKTDSVSFDILESDFYTENYRYIDDIQDDIIIIKVYDKKDPYVTYFAHMHIDGELSYAKKFALQSTVNYLREFDSFKYSDSYEITNVIRQDIIEIVDGSRVDLYAIFHQQGSEIPEDHEVYGE